jgi:hypothetical protein
MANPTILQARSVVRAAKRLGYTLMPFNLRPWGSTVNPKLVCPRVVVNTVLAGKPVSAYHDCNVPNWEIATPVLRAIEWGFEGWDLPIGDITIMIRTHRLTGQHRIDDYARTNQLRIYRAAPRPKVEGHKCIAKPLGSPNDAASLKNRGIRHCDTPV